MLNLGQHQRVLVFRQSEQSANLIQTAVPRDCVGFPIITHAGSVPAAAPRGGACAG